MYFSNYPKKPMGGGNPYWYCESCGRTDPEINGNLDGHMNHCAWAANTRVLIDLAKNVEMTPKRAALWLKTDSQERRDAIRYALTCPSSATVDYLMTSMRNEATDVLISFAEKWG